MVKVPTAFVVSKPIEEALNTTEGLKEITSTSTEGSSSVRLSFNLGVDVMKMQPEVQGKVARIRRQLPRDIEEPVIIRFDPTGGFLAEETQRLVSARPAEERIDPDFDVAQALRDMGAKYGSSPGWYSRDALPPI